ncbi:MAG: DUF4129 domain-containing protein [Chloroflexi bacterium]|nr:DUF4129 domain-containing protein [Chloroflexota bacterium]
MAPLVRFALDNDVVTPRDVRFPAWLVLALLFGANLAVRRLSAHPRGARLGMLLGLAAVLVAVAYAFRLDVTRPTEWAAAIAAQAPLSRGIPAVVVVVIGAAAIWWRGMTAVWHDYGELFGGFVIGLSVLGFLMLFAGHAAWERRGMNIWVSAGAFVLSALVALALMAVYEMLSWERFRGRGGPTLSRHWVTATGSILVGILAVGWTGGLLVATDLPSRVGRALEPVGDVLERGVEYLLLGTGYVAFELLGGLMDILRRTLGRLLALLIGFLRGWVGGGAEAVGEAAERSGLGEQGVRLAFWVLLVGLIAAFFYYAFRRYARTYVEGEIDRRESIWSQALIVQQIRSFFRGLRRSAGATPFMALGDVEEARRAIRRLYRRMLVRMGGAGRARPPNLTPRAYERTVQDLVPGERQALHTLTDAYMVARYSPDPPTEEQVQEADRALQRIESELGNR